MAIRLEAQERDESEIEAVIYDGEERLIEVVIARNADANGYQGWLIAEDSGPSSIYWRELPPTLERVD